MLGKPGLDTDTTDITLDDKGQAAGSISTFQLDQVQDFLIRLLSNTIPVQEPVSFKMPLIKSQLVGWNGSLSFMDTVYQLF
mmetsp:Transcript_2296/g.2954  ORF Transcript_2296/g.2954 Transcript_2296/m.2954 type:complete len:81 (+) Transcript_2296:217-459(+)